MKRVLQTIFSVETFGYVLGICTTALVITGTLVLLRLLIGCFIVGYCN